MTIVIKSSKRKIDTDNQYIKLRELILNLLDHGPNRANNENSSLLECLVDGIFQYINDQAQVSEVCTDYEQFYYHAPVSYFLLNPDGLITDANIKGEELLGIQKPFLINRSFSRYLLPEEQYYFTGYLIRAFKEGIWQSCHFKLLKKNMPINSVLIDGQVFNQSTNEKRLLLTVIDTNSCANIKNGKPNTQNQSNNDYLSYEFVLALTHELNHPLGVISNYIHGCLRRLENLNTHRDLLKPLQQSSIQLGRVSEIILRMKNYIHNEDLPREKVSINLMIEELIPVILSEFNHYVVEIKYKKYGKISDIYLNKVFIQQVIWSLARNAIESMQDHNTEEPKLTIETSSLSNDMIEISLSDNGPGYAPEIAHRLFEPHFTTKQYGIGLGLSISKKIVESHGGKLSFDLNPTYGSCFRITLPVNDSC